MGEAGTPEGGGGIQGRAACLGRVPLPLRV